MDVKIKTFLNGELDEKSYIEQLEEFVSPYQETKACKLIKDSLWIKTSTKTMT